MKQIRRGVAGIILLLSAIMPLSAHHAIAAKFDPAKTTRLRGTVTKVDWLNPHVHIFIDVKDAKGVATNWAIELESVVNLDRNGWSAATIKPGDTITADGPVARDGTHQIWGNAVSLTSGKRVFPIADQAPAARSNQPVPRGPDG